MFLGRKRELQIFNRFLNEPMTAALILYGRRRIGKTELIKEAIRLFRKDNPEIPVLYYEAKAISGATNLNSLTTAVQELYQNSRLYFSDLEDLLGFLFENAVQQPIIVVLDEYPYLKKNVEGIDSILQCLIDKWKFQSKLKLVLSGSFIDIMKSLLRVENPLHGRFQYQIRLEPMDYYDSSKFYPNFSNEDKIRLYSVFGGVPFYNSLIRSDWTVEKNIKELIASQNSQLGAEISMLLSGEIQKIENGNEVLLALAHGCTRFKDLRSKTGLVPMSLTNILDKLIEIGLIEKEAPLNDKANHKKTIYRIKDRFALFYFAFILLNDYRMVMLSGDLFYQLVIHKKFESQFVPKCFEQVCKEYLIRANNAGQMEIPFFDIGRFYYDLPKEKKNGEFDNVTLDEQGYCFYESKFTNSPVTEQMIDKEIQQVNETGLYCRKYGFFSRSGFNAADRRNVEMITLDQMFDPVLEYKDEE